MKVIYLVGFVLLVGLSLAYDDDFEDDVDDELMADPHHKSHRKTCQNVWVGRSCRKVKKCNRGKYHYAPRCRYVQKCRDVFKRKCYVNRCREIRRKRCRTQRVCHPKYFLKRTCRYLPKCRLTYTYKKVCQRHCRHGYGKSYGKRCYNKCYKRRVPKQVCTKPGVKFCFKGWGQKRVCKNVKTCWKQTIRTVCSKRRH